MGLFNKSGGNAAQAQQQRALGAVRIQTSAEGGAKPIVYGQNRVPGFLLDYTDFAHIAHTSSQANGGKGGGLSSTSSTTYTYTAALIIGLCWGPITTVKQIWPTSGVLPTNQNQESYTVPSGGGTFIPSPPSSGHFHSDEGVGYTTSYSQVVNDYGGDGTQTLTGTHTIPFKSVPGSPAAGQYQYHTSTHGYTFAAADVGKTVAINYSYTVPRLSNTSSNGNPLSILNFTQFTGALGQAPWGFMTTNHPARALGYNLTAYLANSALNLGSSATIPNNSYEVASTYQFGAGIVDANPKDIVNDIIASPYYGTTFRSADLGDFTEFSNYCVANGIFLSPVIDTQMTCASVIDQIMLLTNSACVWTEGKLKFRTYGDQSTVGNGATFIANTTPIYDLWDADFLASPGTDPILIQIAPPEQQYNSTSIEVLSRVNGYNPAIIQDKDEAAIQENGLRTASVITAHEICDPNIGKIVVMNINRRSCNIVRTFQFTLALKYILLEPMDMVTLTDTKLGLNKYPVRITQIEEDKDGNLAVTAEEFPYGNATATKYATQTTSGFRHNITADPGNVNNPIIFEATNRLSGFTGNTIVLGVSGQQATWGGCTIWVSQDNTTFRQVPNGKIFGPARMGTLSATLGTGSDPDTTNTISVNLAESFGVLTAGSTADADSPTNTMCYLDGELISYSAATQTSAYNYNLGTYLRRGLFGTAISSHAIGAVFLRMDSAIFKYVYDPTWAGKTIYFKFTSFNNYAAMEQSLSDVASYGFLIPGVANGSVDASSGLIIPYSQDNTTVLQNPNFEVSSVLIPPPGWMMYTEGGTPPTFAYDTATPQSGTASIRITCNATTFVQGLRQKQVYKVIPGEQYKVSGYIKSDGTHTGYIICNFLSAVGGYLGNAVAQSNSASWTFVSGVGTVPAGATQAIFLIVGNAAYTFEADNCGFVRVASLDDETSDGLVKYAPRSGIVTGTENSVYNSDFEIFPDGASIAEGWMPNFEVSPGTYSFALGGGFTGRFSQEILNGTGGTSMASRPITVKGGLRYTFGCRAWADVANPGTMYFRIIWYSNDADFSRTSSSLISTADVVASGGPTAAFNWQFFGGVVGGVGEIVAPLNARFCRIVFYNWVGGSCRLAIDTVTMQQSTQNPADGYMAPQGTLMPIVVNGGFTASQTGTTIGPINWSGVTFTRPDGTIQTVPNGGIGPVTGLATVTTYSFYPYFNETTGTLGFVTASESGTTSTGTLGIAFTAANRNAKQAQFQQLWARDAIESSSGTTYITFTTTSGGTVGGGDGPGGSCLRDTMLVEERTKGLIPAWQVEAGDWLRNREGWTQVVFSQRVSHQYFVQVTVNGHVVEVTPTHPFEAMDENSEQVDVRAANLSLLHQLYIRTGAASVEKLELIHAPEGHKMVIQCENNGAEGEHTFFAGETEPYILSHNMRIIS